jgi:hypothetical protein
MKASKTRKEKKIRGKIIPAKTDQKGEIIWIALLTDNKTEYLVERSKIGMELYPLIDHEIWVKGTFRERLDGKTLIKITHYQEIMKDDNQ